MTLLAETGMIKVTIIKKGGGHMKKRAAAMFLAVWMVLALAGCGGKEEEPAKPAVEPTPIEEPEPEPTLPPLPSSTPSNDDWLVTT